MPSEKHTGLLTLQRNYNELFKQGKNALQSIAKTIKDNSADEKYKLDITNLQQESNEVSFYFIGINFFVRIEHNFTDGKLVWGIKRLDCEEEIRKPYVEHKFDHLGNLNHKFLTAEAGQLLKPTLDKIISAVRAEDEKRNHEFK